MYSISLSFFFNDTATTEIYTLSLHDALPISPASQRTVDTEGSRHPACRASEWRDDHGGRLVMVEIISPEGRRSEEHTSELQSQSNLVCRLLLEKKKKKKKKK